jgi:hypothetical protein
MRKRRSTLIISSLLLVPLAASCGSSDRKYSPITPTIRQFAQGLCDAAFRCCTPGEVGWYFAPFITAANCTDRVVAASEVSPDIRLDSNANGALAFAPLKQLSVLIPNMGALDRAVRDGRTEIDGKALQACLDFLGKLECNKPPEKPDDTTCKPPDPPADPGPCDPSKLFVGKLKEGDTCTSGGASFECGPGLLCVEAGELGVTGQCVHAGQVGEPCFRDSDCDSSLYCSMLDGTCEKRHAEGEPCAYADHLDPSPDPATLLVKCREDLSCDPITDTCVAHCQQGAACSSDLECDQTQNLTCIGESSGGGRCDVPRAAGLPCDAHADCADGLHCSMDPGDTQKVCHDGLDVGTPCVDHVECKSKFCSPTTRVCAPQVPAGNACPSGQDAECDGGYCQDGGTYCTADTDCTAPSKCDPVLGQCTSVCIAFKPEGAICTTDRECAPGSDPTKPPACVAGFCRTPPLLDGQQCSSDDQCQSQFCGLDTPRTCTLLPLPVGAHCGNGSQCETLLCFGSDLAQPTCTTGRSEGDLCDPTDPTQIGCDPRSFYCNTEQDPPRCAAFLETGDECRTGMQCRSGSCEVPDSPVTGQEGRKLCAPAAKPQAAVCDGQP